MKKIYLTLSFTFISISFAQSQMANTDNYGNMIISTEVSTYDDLIQEFQKLNSPDFYNQFINEFITIDSSSHLTSRTPDDIFKQRLLMMATEVQLPYNGIIKNYLIRYSRPNFIMNQAMGMGKYYFPIFEEALYRHNLPMELKILPVIESAMVARARSSASAMGLWQFMLRTGKAYGLEINTFVDERCDPIKSTEAACEYLKDLYAIYHDWTLVIAAYNCGLGNVNKALRRAGEGAKTYWDIYDYLPSETRGYVPAFIAANYAYTFHKVHGIEPIDTKINIATDTVNVTRITHLKQVAEATNTPVELLRELNPQYIRDIIPATNSSYSLVLPFESASRYYTLQDTLKSLEPKYLSSYLTPDNLDAKELATRNDINIFRTYKVKSGDTLGHIAIRHNTSVNKLRNWNNMKNSNLRIGQRLKILN